MTTEDTQPPHQPNTFRTWLPRIWRCCTAAVVANPDIALAVFLILFVIAAIL